MKRTKILSLTTISVIAILVLSILIYKSCEYTRYADAVIEESRNRFDNQKKYIYNLSFDGQIIDKDFHSNYEICKYTIKIQLNNLNIRPIISNYEYPPYFRFNDLYSIFSEIREKNLFMKQINNYICNR